MMSADIWKPLSAELDRWRDAGKTATFWLRDDDAVEPMPALARLLDLTQYHAVPVTLAVIPVHTGQVLADYLDQASSVGVVVHGWSHANHADQGEKKQELGPQRPADAVLTELKTGFLHLQHLHARRFVPVLVPPWNRIAPPLIPQLASLGFRGLSVFGPEKQEPIRLFNTHVDLMDWHGTRGAREPAALVADIVKRLQQMFETDGAMGLLTHHLVHDEAGWTFLDALFGLTTQHPACRWMPLADMLDER